MKFSKIIPLIFENENNDNFVVSFLKFLKGQITKYDLEESDPFISSVKKMDPIYKSRIYLDMDENTFFEELELSESDIWALKSNGDYGDIEISDYYTILDDFSSGYYFDDTLDNENVSLLKQISNLLLPNQRFLYEDRTFKSKLANILYTTFKDEVDKIIYEYKYLNNDAWAESLDQEIKNNFWKPVNDFGFYFDFNNDLYIESSELLMRLRYYNYEGELRILIDKIISELIGNISNGWTESYNFYDGKFFKFKSFNIVCKSVLNGILTSLYDIEDLDESVNFASYLSEKYDFDKWHDLTRNNSKYVSFTIDKINLPEKTIYFMANYPGKGIKGHVVSFDEFNEFISNPDYEDKYD
jgi:hypothetical protein